MNHRIRKGLLLGLSTSMLIATPALAGPPDGKGKNKGAGVTVSDGEQLRAAIDQGNAAAGPFVISLRSGTYDLGAPAASEDANVSGDLDVLGDIVIKGNGATIDLSGLGDRAFEILPGASLAVEKLTVTGAEVVGESGGAFDNDGTLTLDKVTATDNTVSGTGASGGAVDNTGTLVIDRSTFSGNSATRAGGAIETTNGTVRIGRSELVGNSTGDGPGNGGALHVSGMGDGTAVIDRTLVSGNTAATEGGGLWAGAGGNEMTVTRSAITGNVANGAQAINGGGGLFNKGGLLVVDKSVVSGNTATMGSGSGGGIFNLGELRVDRTEISDNAAARAGGGVETVDGTVRIDRSELVDNIAGPMPGNGGGLHVSGGGDGTAVIDRTLVSGNTAASEGGGLWAGAGGNEMTVTRSTITDNVANGAEAINGGGGLFNKGGLLIVERSVVSGNTAAVGSGSGGGILNLGTLVVEQTEISDNDAARAGGGIESNAVNGAGNATLSRVTLTDNTTGANPGNGGGMHVTGVVTTTIDDSIVTGNFAANEGGGLWNFNGATMTVTNTSIVGNDSPKGPNVFQNGAGGNFTVDGQLIPPGDNDLAFP